MSKEKRSEFRVNVVNEQVNVEINKELKVIKLKDISKKGAFLEDCILKPGETGKLIITLPSNLGTISIPFVVKRTQWAKVKKLNNKVGVGVEFKEVNPQLTRILESYVVYVRNMQIIKVSRRIIEDFFNPKP